MEKVIKEFPNYTINENGIIKNTLTGKIRKPTLSSIGYYLIDLYNKDMKKKFYLHRLIAEYFVHNPDPVNKIYVNHIDGDKTNNKISNLEWVTPSENIIHAYKTGLQSYKRKESKDMYKHYLLNYFLKGITITEIAENYSLNALTQLSYHLKEAAIELDILDLYEDELKRQKQYRAKINGNKRVQKKLIGMFDKNTKILLNTFNSLTEARIFLNKKSSGPISNNLSGRTKSGYGYIWKELTSTTIPIGSTLKAIASGNVFHPEKDEDIV